MVLKLTPFNLDFMAVSKRWLTATAVISLLVLGGCGDEGSSKASSEPSVVQDRTAVVQVPQKPRTPEGFNVHEGVRLAEGLITELSGIPLPDGSVVFEVGVAYNANQDPRQTAIQTVHFTLTPQALLAFYLTALPAEGFEVKSSVDAFEQASRAVIEFTSPEGVPGRLFFNPGAWSNSQMRINLYRGSEP